MGKMTYMSIFCKVHVLRSYWEFFFLTPNHFIALTWLDQHLTKLYNILKDLQILFAQLVTDALWNKIVTKQTTKTL